MAFKSKYRSSQMICQQIMHISDIISANSVLLLIKIQQGQADVWSKHHALQCVRLVQECSLIVLINRVN
jgi:hypothetical protein